MITSTSNEHIKEIAKLLKKKYRDRQGRFLVEGFHLVEEARNAGLLVEVFTTDESVSGTFVSKEVIAKLSTTQTPQPVIGLVSKPQTVDLGNKVLVLNNVQDPGNAGTLIRSAVAFGYSGVLVQGVDVFNPKVLRSSQGALFHIPVEQTEDVSFHFEGYETIGALVDAEATPYSEVKPTDKFMLVVGNEGNGIEPEVITKLDKKVYIPIEFESLNVSIAGAILMNEYK